MPVEFLSKEQREKYGKFKSEPSQEQLATYFLLDDQDKITIFKCREKHNQLGFAIQLATVRFLGMFLSNPIDVPKTIINYVSYQLGIDPESITFYKASRTIWSHT